MKEHCLCIQMWSIWNLLPPSHLLKWSPKWCPSFPNFTCRYLSVLLTNIMAAHCLQTEFSMGDIWGQNFLVSKIHNSEDRSHAFRYLFCTTHVYKHWLQNYSINPWMWHLMSSKNLSLSWFSEVISPPLSPCQLMTQILPCFLILPCPPRPVILLILFFQLVWLNSLLPSETFGFVF